MTLLLRRLVTTTANAVVQSYRTRTVELAHRCLSSSSVRSGLDEFFPPGVYDGENVVDMEPVSGRKYRYEELRSRSNVDLHKLWYVCLKERNMLLTMEGECKKIYMPMPGPTRKDKVEKTMKRIRFIVNEREQAIQDLEMREWKFDNPPTKAATTEDAIPVEDDADDTAVHLSDNNTLSGPAPPPTSPGPKGMWLKDILKGGKNRLSYEEQVMLEIDKLNGKNKYLIDRHARRMRRHAGEPEEEPELSEGALPESGWEYEKQIVRPYKRVESKPLPFEDWMKPVISSKKRKELEEAAVDKQSNEPPTNGEPTGIEDSVNGFMHIPSMASNDASKETGAQRSVK